MPTGVKQPQDRKPKAPKTFTFTTDAGTFELPSFKDTMTAAQLRQVLTADDIEQVTLRIAAQALEALASPEALAAYDALLIDQGAKIMAEWIDYSMGE